MGLFSCDAVFDEIMPLFGITHIEGWVVLFFLNIGKDFLGFEFSITIDFCLRNNINDFFSGKVFILRCFSDLRAIRICINIFFKIFFCLDALFNFGIFIFNSIGIIGNLKFLDFKGNNLIKKIHDKKSETCQHKM